ncbi:MAG: LuxR C-terminal-related transcriptional regulator [Puniceicoccales bacterium]
MLIAEDHVLVRDTIKLWLSGREEFKVADTAESVAGVSKSLKSRKIDIVILDLALGDDDALHEIEHWKASHPDVRFLILSASRNYLIAKRALDSGAHAFVSKSDPAEELIKGLLSTRKGLSYVSHSISPYMGREKSGCLPDLTRREEEILREIASGRNNRGIADRLGISGKTVERHRENIKRKLQLTSSSELIREAVRLFPSESP